jgi:translation initiation factor IF-2
MDRPDANPDYVKHQLSDAGLVPDEWEGSTIVVPVSAKQLKGIDDLLEAILLVADSVDIQANPEGKVIGTVIEAQLDKAKGPVATLLVQNGSLEMGDTVIAGESYGRIKAMFDFRGRKLRKASPSMPVQVMGLNGIPEAGNVFQVLPSERDARVVIDERKNQALLKQANVPKATLEELFQKFQAGEVKELRLIVKADVQGSLEPIKNSLNDLNTGEISINILYAETGNITENDVSLAAASKAIVLGFNVSADTAARRKAEVEGVSIRVYDIIYRLIEDIEKALKGMLTPEFKEVILGRAEILQIFHISKVGNIAGCRVALGEIRRNAKARLVRAGQVIFDGELSSLKHEKEDVREVRQGFDCGIALKNFNDYAPGDILECYILKRTTDE